MSRFVLSHTAESCLLAWRNWKLVLPSQKYGLIFALHHMPHRLFFLLVNKPSSDLSLCNALVLLVPWMSHVCSKNTWMRHVCSKRQNAKSLAVKLGCSSPSFWSPMFVQSDHTTNLCWGILPMKSADRLKIDALRELVWVVCFGHKQHSCPFYEIVCFKVLVMFLLSVIFPLC